MGGQNFFVENRGGGGGIIGIEAVINAPRDGYTLLMAPSTVAVLPAITKHTRYDAAKDLAAITQVAGISNVLVVHPDVPVKTLKDLIALAKAKPGKLNYGSAGAGSSPHMGMELLKHMAGIDLQHIPFSGSGPAMTEILSGRIAALFSNLHRQAADRGGQASRAGGVRTEARRGDAGRADRGRGRRAGLLGSAMVRTARARRHAAADHRQAPGHGCRGVALARRPRAARPGRRGACGRHVRGIRRPDQGRPREMVDHRAGR